MDERDQVGAQYHVLVRPRDLAEIHAGELFLVEFSRTAEPPSDPSGQPASAQVLVGRTDDCLQVLSVRAEDAASSPDWLCRIVEAAWEAVRVRLEGEAEP